MAASKQRIKADGLYVKIGAILDGYTADIARGVEQEADKASKSLVEQLRSSSPRRTGAYAKSWGRIKQNGIYIVRNAKHWQLTVLLENGHRKRGGKGMVRAYPHIAENARKVVEAFQAGIKRLIGGTG